jgi:hypothetical protein
LYITSQECKNQQHAAVILVHPPQRQWIYLHWLAAFGNFRQQKTEKKFELRVSVHRGLMNKIPTRCSKSSLFSFVLCSTCFGRYIHPSSGASTVQAGMV